ncbi:xanthine phosphoribosyltransferase [Companilactobacillus sp.]|uniref:xanthine phosphoribosyltransferase n=1 Tax=Companilactobacillus sp. TaxID=2767905 RepID=UPI0025C22F31|nr:xanthine phosphoribosyltransferase [Companilactobacillus sp.]MCH4008932.1 xanthine phosphoribosyltransferase [Companilactobacillus sp.]MCH4050889.1 xanthine phosphoribosyltransferase [Companilactobacillus sp.]MCH4076875.1 xanthine phosphoribosyltransferase [Companilactobacillus sp.]MCH4125450.1 xanthine phosphoribosyltransferase [Companilactobacillus sp.]MCH4131992.1 xanthine phosphoribosyltransferase [Companilactobacillus sp.]
MRELEERINKDGRVIGKDVLKVDSFLNHQIDPVLMEKMGEEFYNHFKDAGVTKILTVESSGIAPAVMTGLQFKVPVVFARKHKSVTLKDDLYTSEVYSFTKKTSNHISISKKYLSADDKVLIIDDFLANGQAVNGLSTIIDDAKADLVGIGIVIEKSFQKGRQLIDKEKIPVYSLARIKAFEDGHVVFQPEQD